MVGGFVVTAAFLTIILGFISYVFGSFEDIVNFSLQQTIESSSLPRVILMFAPVFFVHLWLPLFLVGALGIRAVFLFVEAAKWAQWFLKGGYQRPIRAIGTVAAVVVLASTAIVQVFPSVEVSWGKSRRWLEVNMSEIALKFEKLAGAHTPDGCLSRVISAMPETRRTKCRGCGFHCGIMLKGRFNSRSSIRRYLCCGQAKSYTLQCKSRTRTKRQLGS